MNNINCKSPFAGNRWTQQCVIATGSTADPIAETTGWGNHTWALGFCHRYKGQQTPGVWQGQKACKCTAIQYLEYLYTFLSLLRREDYRAKYVTNSDCWMTKNWKDYQEIFQFLRVFKQQRNRSWVHGISLMATATLRHSPGLGSVPHGLKENPLSMKRLTGCWGKCTWVFLKVL